MNTNTAIFTILMDTIFMNSENSKTSKPHVVTINFTDKIDLRRSEKSVVLSNHSIYYTWKKCQLPLGMITLNYLMDHILYQIFKTILTIS